MSNDVRLTFFFFLRAMTGRDKDESIETPVLEIETGYIGSVRFSLGCVPDGFFYIYTEKIFWLLEGKVQINLII